MEKISGKEKFVKNIYTVKKKSFEIVIQKMIVEWNRLNHRGSNIEEFFDVIDW